MLGEVAEQDVASGADVSISHVAAAHKAWVFSLRGFLLTGPRERSRLCIRGYSLLVLLGRARGLELGDEHGIAIATDRHLAVHLVDQISDAISHSSGSAAHVVALLMRQGIWSAQKVLWLGGSPMYLNVDSRRILWQPLVVDVCKAEGQNERQDPLPEPATPPPPTTKTPCPGLCSTQEPRSS